MEQLVEGGVDRVDGESEAKGDSQCQDVGGFLQDIERALMRRKEAEKKKKKKEMGRNPSKRKRVCLYPKTTWSREETEALFQAIECCVRTNNLWSVTPNRWVSVLQHMEHHGFSDKTISTILKKYQNLHWAFRNLKAWRCRGMLPLYEDLSSKERTDRLLPRAFQPWLYTRMEAFFASTSLDDGVNTVKNQDRSLVPHAGAIRHAGWGLNGNGEDVADDGDDEDDDDDDPTFTTKHKKGPNHLALALQPPRSRRGKANDIQGNRIRTQFHRGNMRGCLLVEGMDVLDVLNGDKLDEGVEGSSVKKEEEGMGIVKEGEHMESLVSEKTNISMGTMHNVDDDEGNDKHDHDMSRLKKDHACHGDDVGPQTRGRGRRTDSVDPAMNRGSKAQKSLCFCQEDIASGMSSRIDETTHAIILQHMVSTDEQLSKFIETVQMSIKTVNLFLVDKR